MADFLWQKQIKALLLCGIFVSLQVGGCANTKPHEIERTESFPNVIRCTKPRPEICTQEYTPVCAELANGAIQTYASGCVACSDANVVSYRSNPCE